MRIRINNCPANVYEFETSTVVRPVVEIADVELNRLSIKDTGVTPVVINGRESRRVPKIMYER